MRSEIRIHAHDLRQDRLEALLAWVQSLGVDPKDVRPELVLIQGEQEWELHLSRYKRDDQGRTIPDHALNQVVSEPLVIGVGTRQTWPDLTGGTAQ